MGPCELTCQEPNATATQGNCSVGQAPGCVGRRGHFHSQAGPCVTAGGCKCWRHGQPHWVRHRPAVPPTPLKLGLPPVPILGPGHSTGTLSASEAHLPLKHLLLTPVPVFCPSQAPRLGWGWGGIVVYKLRDAERRMSPSLPSLDPNGRRPERAAAASVEGVSASSTAPSSPVPRYPPVALLPSQSGSPASSLGLCPEAGLRASGRQCPATGPSS